MDLSSSIQAFAAVDDEEKPISYTVKLKDSVENITPAVKRRSIIKLPSKWWTELNDPSNRAAYFQKRTKVRARVMMPRVIPRRFQPLRQSPSPNPFRRCFSTTWRNSGSPAIGLPHDRIRSVIHPIRVRRLNRIPINSTPWSKVLRPSRFDPIESFRLSRTRTISQSD